MNTPLDRSVQALIYEMFDVIDLRDWCSLARVFDKDVVYERPGYPRFEGIERVTRFYQKERQIESGTHRIDSIVVSESNCVCWGEFSGIHCSGNAVNARFADVYLLNGSLIRTRTTYFFTPMI